MATNGKFSAILLLSVREYLNYGSNYFVIEDFLINIP